MVNSLCDWAQVLFILLFKFNSNNGSEIVNASIDSQDRDKLINSDTLLINRSLHAFDRVYQYKGI